jgi:hypothetical protein
MVHNLSQNIVYDDSTTCLSNTIFIIKKLVTRLEFIDLVRDIYKVDYEVIHKFCVSEHVDGTLTDLLKHYVKDKYSVLDANIQLDESQYDILFPETQPARIFYVVINFQDKHTINRMKLKYPEVMSEVTGK